MKVAHAELPRIQRQSRITLDPKVVKEAVSDLVGSVDFAPHAYTDGNEYATYAEAQSVARITGREVAAQTGEDPRMIRTRVWEKNGLKDRDKKGKWVFALSRRSSPPKERQAKAA